MLYLLFSLLAGLTAAAPTGKYFDHVMIMMFENHAEDEVIKDPNFLKYRNMGRGLMNYFAISHPSQPNYIAQIAGDTCGVKDDSDHDLSETNLIDLYEAAGVSWKSYNEDYPGNCRADAVIGKYYRKHNPFISFDNIRKNATRCANIVGSAQLDTDLANGQLPNFAYYVPNIDNDAHNTGVAFAGKYLDTFLSARLSKLPPKTLLIVTWDEDDHSQSNQVLTFMIGANFKAGSADNTLYDHYSLLATLEDNWSVGNLGRNDKNAKLINMGAKSVDAHNGTFPESRMW
jgi:acid phosphatase